MINEVCCIMRYQKGKRVTIGPERDGSAPKDDHQLSLMTRINLQKPGKKPDVVVHICNPRTPVARWEVDNRISLKPGGHSMVAERPCLSKVKRQTQLLNYTHTQ